MKIVMGDKNLNDAQTIAKNMNDAGFDVVPVEMDLSDRASILNLITEAKKYGPITKLVNGALSPASCQMLSSLRCGAFHCLCLVCLHPAYWLFNKRCGGIFDCRSPHNHSPTNRNPPTANLYIHWLPQC